MRWVWLPVGLLLSIAVQGAATAGVLQDENILAPMPAGFKVGYHANSGGQLISEYVPSSETVDNWSTMITVQIFRNLKYYNPDAWAHALADRWKSTCTGGDAGRSAMGSENGYAFSVWL